MTILRSPYFLVPLFLDLAALGAILAGPLREPGVPLVWLLLMALSAPWVLALLLWRLAARRSEDRARESDFV